MVNSLHSQGVNRLGDELEVEAVADDGLIEAFTVRNAPGFTLAVQWHPEWKVAGKSGLRRDFSRLWRCLPGLSPGGTGPLAGRYRHR